MSQSGRTLRWEVRSEVRAFVKMWKGWEEGMEGKKSSELRTRRQGLLGPSCVWKRIWGICDMPVWVLALEGGKGGLMGKTAGGGCTGSGFYGEIAETGDCPGVLVGFHEAAPVVGVVDYVEEELGVGLDGVDAGVEEEPGRLLVPFDS